MLFANKKSPSKLYQRALSKNVSRIEQAIAMLKVNIIKYGGVSLKLCCCLFFFGGGRGQLYEPSS